MWKYHRVTYNDNDSEQEVNVIRYYIAVRINRSIPAKLIIKMFYYLKLTLFAIISRTWCSCYIVGEGTVCSYCYCRVRISGFQFVSTHCNSV